jgi:hypothetical protein
MSCPSFCDDYYLPHLQKVKERHLARFKRHYPNVVLPKTSKKLTTAINKLTRKVCLDNFCNPSCVTKLNRAKTKKFKQFKKRGALSACDPYALI